MRVTQGTFSYLPDLTDAQILAQVGYCLELGWALSVEHSDDPHPRQTYWEMWDAPMFDVADPAEIMVEVKACRKAFPDRYIKLNAFDPSPGWESLRLSFIVNRPEHEPGFTLVREEGPGRTIRYTTRPTS